MLAIIRPEGEDNDPVEERQDPLADPKDLRLEMKVKNNVLWRAIHDQYGSVFAMCKAKKQLRNNYAAVYALLNFTKHPCKKNRAAVQDKANIYSDEYRTICLVLAEVLGISAEVLFPRHLYDELVGTETSKAVELSSFTALPAAARREIRALPAPTETPGAQIDVMLLRSRIKEVLRSLSYREREIIKMRFGLEDGYPYTLDEVAQVFKVSRGCIRQIEAKAIRKLQQPSRSGELMSFL